MAIGKPSRSEGKATTSGALDAGVDREQSLTRRQKGEPPARKKRRDISTFFMVSLYFYKDDCMTCAAPMSPPGAGRKRNKNFPTLSSVEEGKDFHAMGTCQRAVWQGIHNINGRGRGENHHELTLILGCVILSLGL